MRIAFFGDVVGKPGRRALAEVVPKLRAEKKVDLVLANVENAAHGFGITPSIIEELHDIGVDVFTGGNHTWKNKSGSRFLEEMPETVLRPANYIEELPGRGWTKFEHAGVPVLVINLLGEVFMKNQEVESPFEWFDTLYEQHGKDAVVIVDLHAEATGEKRAFGWYVQDRATLVVGTHTHVPTSDAQILVRDSVYNTAGDNEQLSGTAYVTDLGMTGAVYSSLGMDIDLVLQKVAHKIDVSLEPPIEPKQVVASGILATIDKNSRQALSIERIDQVIDI